MRKMILMLKVMSLAALMLIVGCGGSVYGEEASPSGGGSNFIILSFEPGANNAGSIISGNYTIQSYNQESGELTNCAEFIFEKPTPGMVRYLHCPSFYANHKNWFSENLDRMAVTMVLPEDESTHAGWIDQTGNFNDVTEMLGLASEGDFADPVYYYTIGFAEDGSFVYYKKESDTERIYYYVDPDNLDPVSVHEGNPSFGQSEQHSQAQYWGYNGYSCRPTDWIDNTHCIADYKDRCIIYDIESEEATDFIPSTSRICWDGILSPDGQEIVFLSKPESGTEAPALFIIPKNGGEPAKLTTQVSFTDTYEVSTSIYNYWGDGYTTLMDWK